MYAIIMEYIAVPLSKVRSLRVTLTLPVFGLILMICSYANAYTHDDYNNIDPEQWVISKIKEYERIGSYRSGQENIKSFLSIKQKFIELYSQIDYGFDGISKKDIEYFSRNFLQRNFAAAISNWHLKDQNSDLKVTREELERHHLIAASKVMQTNSVIIARTNEQIKLVLDELVKKELRQDTDKDGEISLKEAIDYIKNNTALKNRHFSRYSSKRLIPFSFDSNSDGSISKQEYISVVEKVISDLDLNKDGDFSGPEEKNYNERLQLYNKQFRKINQRSQKSFNEARKLDLVLKKLENCGKPKISANAHLLYVSTQMGSALTNINFSGSSAIVKLSEVNIEEGENPLVVILKSNQSQIWKFTGAVHRVEAVWASSNKRNLSGGPQSGVIGLPKEKIFFTTQGGCLPDFSKVNFASKIQLKRLMKSAFGRKPDNLVSAAKLGQVKLPSGKYEENLLFPNNQKYNNSDNSAALWSIDTDNGTASYVFLKKAELVTNSKFITRKTLPGTLALAKLVEEGALQVLSKMQVATINNGVTIIGATDLNLPASMKVKIDFRPKKFLIKKAVVLSDHLFKDFQFELAHGAPMPKIIGLKQVSIFSRDQGRPIKVTASKLE